MIASKGPRARRKTPERAPTTPDPVEIAMEAEAAGRAPTGAAHEVLVKQSRLLDEQLKHLRLQGFSERIGAGLKMLGGIAGLAAAGALAVMIWNATQDRSLVIQAFSAPPELVERGLTGEVLASKLLDRLAEIDANADSLRAPETFRNDWGSDIQVEIPQTGVSIGELDRYLRQWLGKRTGIGGEVVRVGEGVALTVRVGAAGAVTRQGAEAEIDALIQQAAEAVFHRTQPFRYSKYLEFTGRLDQAMAVAVDLANNGPPEERAWAWAQISNLHLEAGEMRAAAFAGRRSVALNPDLGLGWLNLSIAEQGLGHERASIEAIVRSVALLTSGRGQLSDTGIAVGYANAAAEPVSRGDFPEARRRLELQAAQTDYMNVSTTNEATIAATAIAEHDIAAARAVIATMPSDPSPDRYSNQTGVLFAPRASLAAEQQDWRAARDGWRAMADAAEPRFRELAITSLAPLLVQAEAELGNAVEAQRIAATLPDDCAACVGAKGLAAEAMGDRAGADRLLARYLRMASPGPFAPAAWGRVKLQRGDIEGALILFRDAQRQGPRWADAYKLEGDALMRLGRGREAAAAYREAIERAPRWAAAHLGLAAALRSSGPTAQAREALASARALPLTAAERATLTRLSANAG